MSLLQLVGLAVVATIASVACNIVTVVLTARLWKVPGVGFARAFRLTLVWIGLSLVAGAAMLILSGSAGSDMVAVPICLLLYCLQWMATAKLLGASRGRAFLVWISTTLIVAAIGVLIGFGLRMFTHAYITPTGSMAPTIIGLHCDEQCASCGYTFAASLAHRRDERTWLDEPEKLKTLCVNCREPHAIGKKTKTLQGDRFLVDKTAAPVRWSVVAFRQPSDRSQVVLKRLVGLHGEKIELARGDVFIDGKLLRKEPHVATDLWLPLHDSSFVPKAIHEGTPHWRPRDEKSGWRQAGSTWTVEPTGEERQSLEFVGSITDVVSYNAEPEHTTIPLHSLGDVLVACRFVSLAGDGDIRFEWAFAGSDVVANISATGNVAIQATAASGDRARAQGRFSSPLSDGDSLAFAVRDGQAYVLKGDDLAALATFGPNDVESFAALGVSHEKGCKLALSVGNYALSIDRITIHRDVYYIDRDEAGEVGEEDECHSCTLGPDEWFLLGDNSARSYDSRMYSGAQSSDLMGVARWIYWPPARWRELK